VLVQVQEWVQGLVLQLVQVLEWAEVRAEEWGLAGVLVLVVVAVLATQSLLIGMTLMAEGLERAKQWLKRRKSQQ